MRGRLSRSIYLILKTYNLGLKEDIRRRREEREKITQRRRGTRRKKEKDEPKPRPGKEEKSGERV